MPKQALREEVGRDGRRRLLVLYHTAFLAEVSQAVACNGLHSVLGRCCCRWLLMTQNRAHSNVFPMTHEFLAEMLGVRRSTVSEVLEPFQRRRIDPLQPGETHGSSIAMA